MATLKQRLHRKNASGTYDVIHYETDSTLVIMGDGNTLEYKMANHTHDNRYFTETEVTTKLNRKANSIHTHTVSDITDYSSNPPAASNIWPFSINWSKIKTFEKSYGTVDDITEDLGINVTSYDAIAIALTKLGGTFENSSNYNDAEITISVDVDEKKLIKIVQNLNKSGKDPTGWNMNGSILTPYRASLIRLNKRKYRDYHTSTPTDSTKHTYLLFSDRYVISAGTVNIDQSDPVIVLNEHSNSPSTLKPNLMFMLDRTSNPNSCYIQNFSVSIDIYGGTYQ